MLFEFLRNTDLDARNYFSPTRGAFDQNQFGGTFGGPIRKNKVFFFADYQGTRSTQGIDTGEIPVPSLQDRSGNLQRRGRVRSDRNRERPLLGQPAFAEARLRRDRGRALLFPGMHQPGAVRSSERRDPAERVVRSGSQSSAIHSRAQQSQRHLFDLGL